MKRLACLLLLTLAARASPYQDERIVTPGGPGPNRLDVDVALLAGAQPDLRDLRFVDASGEDVAYLLIPAASRQPRWIDGRLLPIVSTKKTSGFELDLGRPLDVDRLKVDGIAAPFLKHVTVEGSGDRQRWTLLADATLFDLPDRDLGQHEIAFEPGEYRYLRLTWDDRSSARVAGSVRASAREHISGGPPERLRFELAFDKRASEPGKSRYRVHLPGAHLPLDAIELEVASGDVFREAAVTEPRLGNNEVIPVRLGTAKLKRAERDGIVGAEMSVPIVAPEGRDLDLVVEDGNNKPLAITAIRGRLAPQPWIYFDSPDGAPLRARYGDPSASAPHYDLEASRHDVESKKPARATWASSAKKVSIPVSPEIALPAGSAIDREEFRIRRRLPDAPAGLTVLILDAHVLARARDLADVRLADAGGTQIPYLVERRTEPLTVDLAVPSRRVEGSTSVYRFDLPFDHWPTATKLVVTTGARVFDRNVVAYRLADGRRDRGDGPFASTRWRSVDPELLPPALSLDIPARRTRSIEIVVDEGDNAPLPILSARLLLPSYALRFQHPGTELFLLYGNPKASAPRYDLQLLAPRLFGAPARELTLIATHQPESADQDARDRKWFWLAISVAALVLIAILVRLLGSPPDGGETTPSPDDSK